MSEKEPVHYFSPDEVNALIPFLEEHFQQFWAFRQNAQNILQELRKNARDARDPSSSEIATQQIRQSQAHFLLERAKKELDAILESGCTVKDLEIGLVDFPHILEYEEEEVYLCWKYGEKKVRFWHELNEGFASRKPLTRKPYPQR
jgi:hypothetical protein